jgi:hypothetical protein
MSMAKRRRKLSASVFIGVGRRVDADELQARMQERDRRQAIDDRSEAERWLGDPPAQWSALSRYNAKPSGRKT